MKRIYLHIGRGKTGTTLLQSYLSQKRKALLEQGVRYVFADDRGKGGGHQQFAKSFIRDYPDLMIRAANPKAVRRRVRKEILGSGRQTLILSSENFPVTDEFGVYEFFREFEKTHQVSIILFARTQDELAESEYNQLVKLKRLTCSFSEYVEREFTDCDFMALASRWGRVFGDENVIGRIYDGSKNNLIEQFLSCIPEIRPELLSPYDPPTHGSRINQSIGIKALVTAKALNGVEIDGRMQLYNEIFGQLSKDDLPALLFSSEKAATYRAKFAQSNLAFTKNYVGEPVQDLGGRRYTDEERDSIRADIERMALAEFN